MMILEPCISPKANMKSLSQFVCCCIVSVMEWRTSHNSDNNYSSCRYCWFDGNERTTAESVLRAASMMERTSPNGYNEAFSCCCCWVDREDRTISESMLRPASMMKRTSHKGDNEAFSLLLSIGWGSAQISGKYAESGIYDNWQSHRSLMLRKRTWRCGRASQKCPATKSRLILKFFGSDVW